MKKLALFLMLTATICFVGCTPAQTEIDGTVDMTPRLISSTQTLTSAEIANNVKSAIVGISAKLSNGTSIGSGVAIADGGYILTNFHVVNGGKSFTVYFANKSTAKATFVWGDSALDLAIMKSTQNLPYLDTAPLSEVEIGDDVLAVGTPISLQFQHTFTKGIISALNRTIEVPSLGGYSTYMQNLIQHDASINSGNSGGPLINNQGKIIGINSLKASDAEGIGFAIPIETAMAVAKRVIPDNNFKQVYLGVFTCDAELAEVEQLSTISQGAYIIDIDGMSPLGKTNLKNGDVITKINDKEIKSTLDLRKAIYSLNQGEKVEITFHNGTEIEKTEIIV